MADNLTDTAENLAVNWLFVPAQSPTRPTGPLKVRLMTANGSDSSAGTELGTSGGYTAGGASVTFTTASGGATDNTGSAVSWTNMPATTIVGVEIWDSAGSPVRLAYGALSANKTTNSGDTFTIASGALTISLA